MSVNYDLQVETGGIIGASLADIVSAVSGAIGLYPGYTYQNTVIEPIATGYIIHIYYSDDNATASSVHAEFLPAVPAIVWAILAVLAVLGIAYITYTLVVVAPSSPWVQLTIVAAAVTALALLISAIKKNKEE